MGVSSKCQDRGRRREGKAGVTGCVSSPKTLCPDAGRGGGESREGYGFSVFLVHHFAK